MHLDICARFTDELVYRHQSVESEKMPSHQSGLGTCDSLLLAHQMNEVRSLQDSERPAENQQECTYKQRHHSVQIRCCTHGLQETPDSLPFDSAGRRRGNVAGLSGVKMLSMRKPSERLPARRPLPHISSGTYHRYLRGPRDHQEIHDHPPKRHRPARATSMALRLNTRGNGRSIPRRSRVSSRAPCPAACGRI